MLLEQVFDYKRIRKKTREFEELGTDHRCGVPAVNEGGHKTRRRAGTLGAVA
jgi:hypothetical protein